MKARWDETPMNESLAIETRGLKKVYGSGNTEIVAMH